MITWCGKTLNDNQNAQRAFWLPWKSFFLQISALEAECVYSTWQSTVNKPMKPEDSVVVQVTGHYAVNIVRLVP